MDQNEIAAFQQSIETCKDPVEIARYEEQLRDAALRFILSQERLRVREYRLPAKKQPEALGTGRARGEGFDILSYDRRGEALFISVKVTTGQESEAFRITEAERRKRTRMFFFMAEKLTGRRPRQVQHSPRRPEPLLPEPGAVSGHVLT